MTKRKSLTESETLELKTSLSEKEEILQTISAFSNKRGGKLLVGVEPSGKVVGVTIGKNTIENLAVDIKHYTDPKVFPNIFLKRIDSKDVIEISVPEYPIKPVFVKDKVFIRVGKSNQRASAEKIRSFINEQRIRKWDSESSSAKLSDISPAKIKSFIKRYEEERDVTLADSKSTESIIKKLKLLKGKKPTNAAVLLFSKEPQSHFYNSLVRCARFKGAEAIDFLDMQDVEGTLIEQVPSVLSFIRKHLNIAASIKGKLERVDVWEIPRDALREAIINAICHRDYESTANVQVRIFNDRLEIWNPGLLPDNISIAELKKVHPSVPRNESIARCFYMIKYIEQWGTGTNRIVNLCKEAGIKEPEFKESGGSFIIVFPRIIEKVTPLQINLPRTQKRILDYLSGVEQASSTEIADSLKINRSTVQRNLKSLSSLIEWTGTSAKDPKGKYVIKDHVANSKVTE
jgi:ATP-dependent DNA helicase RecG